MVTSTEAPEQTCKAALAEKTIELLQTHLGLDTYDAANLRELLTNRVAFSECWFAAQGDRMLRIRVSAQGVPQLFDGRKQASLVKTIEDINVALFVFDATR